MIVLRRRKMSLQLAKMAKENEILSLLACTLILLIILQHGSLSLLSLLNLYDYPTGRKRTDSGVRINVEYRF